MMELLEWVKGLHSTEGIKQLIAWGGVPVLIAIIFAETGILAGFFLPGDSLLITAGVLANPANPNHIATFDIATLNLVLVIAAVVGDQLGFYLGTKVADKVWSWKDSRFYKKKYMVEAHDFYMKHGGLAIFGARYVPILRTFVPFAAGVAKMPYRNFVFWNVVGGVTWITSLLWAGYYLGQTKWADRLDKIIVLVIFVSVLPLIFGTVKRIFFHKKDAAEPEPVQG